MALRNKIITALIILSASLFSASYIYYSYFYVQMRCRRSEAIIKKYPYEKVIALQEVKVYQSKKDKIFIPHNAYSGDRLKVNGIYTVKSFASAFRMYECPLYTLTVADGGTCQRF